MRPAERGSVALIPFVVLLLEDTQQSLTCDTLRMSSAWEPRSYLHSLQILFSVDTLDTDSSAFIRPCSTMGNIPASMTGWSASHSARDPEGTARVNAHEGWKLGQVG